MTETGEMKRTELKAIDSPLMPPSYAISVLENHGHHSLHAEG
jgi:hypothetical protein